MGLVMIGCGTQSGPFRATIDASAAPNTALVEVYYASGEPGSMPIATPDILAGKVPAATVAMTWSGGFLVGPGYHDMPVGVGGTATGPLYIGVIGLGPTETGISGGAWSGPIDDPGGAMVELKLDPTLVPEVWGTQAETGKCYRLNTGTTMVYITRPDDPDCDGLTGAQDKQPYAFCDPSATTGPAHDACQ
ncbi:MAG TPA: hypothetical protein VHW23_32370 [Kofleriaceae bacterium]|nr:hypothetical protein [Kofleriaceae bacterium]